MASKICLLVVLINVIYVSGYAIHLYGIVGDKTVFDCQLPSTAGDNERFRPGRREDALCENILTKIASPERHFDGINFSMEIGTADNVEDLKKKFHALGPKIVKLTWTSFDHRSYTFKELNDVFDLMPNLKYLKMSFWEDTHPITGRTGSEVLNLKNLETLELLSTGSSMMEFFTEALPTNVLKHFTVDKEYSDTIFTNFFAHQEAIKSLDLNGNFSDVEVFKKLHLDTFANDLPRKYPPEPTTAHRKFIEMLTKQQSHLTELNLLSVDYAHDHVNDEVLAEICKLEDLTTLRVPIDEVTAEGIPKIGQIKKLKTLEVKSNDGASIEMWKKMSETKMPALKNLILRLWGDELPQEIYKNFAHNLEHLKSLKITLGNRQKLNFFMQNFANLESLSVKFGEANRKMTFEEAYDDDGQKNVKITSLNLIFLGDEFIDTAKFIKMLKAFPNLEKFKINSKFPFSVEFLSNLYENLGKIDDIEFGSFVVPCNEDFPPAKTEILKNFGDKLTNFRTALVNTVDHMSRLMIRKDGKMEKALACSDSNVSFQVLIDALKHKFELESNGYSNIRTVTSLTIRGGTHKRY